MGSLGQWNRKVDFTKICRDCANFEDQGAYPYPVCTASRDIVKGTPRRVECRSARSMTGYCGPEARHYVAREIVEAEASAGEKVVPIKRTGGKK